MPTLFLALLEKIDSVTAPCLPFFLLLSKDSTSSVKLNWSRIVEAVIIAIVTASVIGLTVKDDIKRIEMRVDKIYSDVYHPSFIH